jgi:hypothetical protein
MPPVPEHNIGVKEKDLWRQTGDVQAITSGSTVNFLTDVIWDKKEAISVTLSGGVKTSRDRVDPWFIPDNLWFLTQPIALEDFKKNWGIGLSLDIKRPTITLTSGEQEATINLKETKYSLPLRKGYSTWFSDDTRAIMAGLSVLSQEDFRLATEKGLLVIIEEETGAKTETLALPGTILHKLDNRIPADKSLVIMEFDWASAEEKKTAALLRKNLDKIAPVGVVIDYSLINDASAE